MSVMENLEPEWAHALLRRTRFADPELQGDILSVICTPQPDFLLLLHRLILYFSISADLSRAEDWNSPSAYQPVPAS